MRCLVSLRLQKTRPSGRSCAHATVHSDILLVYTSMHHVPRKAKLSLDCGRILHLDEIRQLFCSGEHGSSLIAVNQCGKKAHDGATHRMSRDQLGVYRRVADSETEGTPDSQLAVQHGSRVLYFAHGAASKRMVQGLHSVPDDLAELFVTQPVKVVVEKRVSRANICQVCQGSCMRNLVCPTDTTNQRIEIMLGSEVAEDNLSNGDRTREPRLTLDQ